MQISPLRAVSACGPRIFERRIADATIASLLVKRLMRTTQTLSISTILVFVDQPRKPCSVSCRLHQCAQFLHVAPESLNGGSPTLRSHLCVCEAAHVDDANLSISNEFGFRK